MLLLEATDLKITIGDRLLATAERLTVQQNDRIGLVGRNGTGKTTILDTLVGKTAAEEGQIIRNGTMELLPQLKHDDQYKSGGETTQQYIKDALAKNPEILLADEPTTHLDTSHIEWLEKILKHWQGALILVSHDRTFLDRVCTKIWEIDEEKVKIYSGNYSQYKRQKELALAEKQQAYEQYEQKKAQLENALTLKAKKAERATKKPKNLSSSEARITGSKPYFAKKQKKLQQTAKSIETRLEKLEKVEKIKDLPSLQMTLPNEKNTKNRMIIRAENLKGKIADHVLFEPASFQIRGGEKWAIIGPNGSGKTTLIKKILQREELTVSPSLKIGYFSQNLDILQKDKTIIENVKETSIQEETVIRTILARLRFFREDVYKKVSLLSGGERVKVALAKILVSEVNTLVLDEPTNFLDIEAVEALEELLMQYKGTILFVSHDRRLTNKVANRLLIIKNKQIEVFRGNHEAYESYEPEVKRNNHEEERLLIETKITEVLSRLSIEPTEELEKEFQQLLQQKKKWQ
ncbi:ABC-F type ribosomal protection protein [Cytobacillus sp. FSL R7-0696]|uniref:Vga family ABC-F type ribosomal protection protein n=1 Tax=Cytobacillus sp. FSL R7-0696 TaxID=2921691 RepID=UPI0030FC246B